MRCEKEQQLLCRLVLSLPVTSHRRCTLSSAGTLLAMLKQHWHRRGGILSTVDWYGRTYCSRCSSLGGSCWPLVQFKEFLQQNVAGMQGLLLTLQLLKLHRAGFELSFKSFRVSLQQAQPIWGLPACQQDAGSSFKQGSQLNFCRSLNFCCATLFKSLLLLPPSPLLFLSTASAPQASFGTRSGDATSRPVWLGARLGNTSKNCSTPLGTSGHSQLSKVPRKSVVLLVSVASLRHLTSGLSIICVTDTVALSTGRAGSQWARGHGCSG